MKSEYKRDINGNYLVLYENEEPDTSSYQMRMLVGNSIPSILKCRVQGVDGQFMVCYDITSKQSLLSLYEEKKMGYNTCHLIASFSQCMKGINCKIRRSHKYNTHVYFSVLSKSAFTLL